jgi:hypothetical protein
MSCVDEKSVSGFVMVQKKARRPAKQDRSKRGAVREKGGRPDEEEVMVSE